MAVPHSASRRRKAAASVVFASLAWSSALTDTSFRGAATTLDGAGEIAAGRGAARVAETLLMARDALKTGLWWRQNCQPRNRVAASAATLIEPTTHPSQVGKNRRP